MTALRSFNLWGLRTKGQLCLIDAEATWLPNSAIQKAPLRGLWQVTCHSEEKPHSSQAGLALLLLTSLPIVPSLLDPTDFFLSLTTPGTGTPR